DKPVLEEGRFPQPKPTKQDIARRKAMIDRAGRRIEHGTDGADRRCSEPAVSDECGCRVENLRVREPWSPRHSDIDISLYILFQDKSKTVAGCGRTIPVDRLEPCGQEQGVHRGWGESKVSTDE